jgi:hypothetical protein
MDKYGNKFFENLEEELPCMFFEYDQWKAAE